MEIKPIEADGQTPHTPFWLKIRRRPGDGLTPHAPLNLPVHKTGQNLVPLCGLSYLGLFTG